MMRKLRNQKDIPTAEYTIGKKTNKVILLRKEKQYFSQTVVTQLLKHN